MNNPYYSITESYHIITVNQKFCNILVTSCTIWQPRILFKRWRLRSTLDCKMSSSPDILHVLLARFTSKDWSTVSESLVWLSKFLQPERNFFNYLVTPLWLTAPSTFAQQIFLVASATLWPDSNSWSISSWITLSCTFLCLAFKSHTEWSNAQRVCAPTNKHRGYLSLLEQLHDIRAAN